VDRAAGLTLEQIWHEYNGFSHLLEGPPKNDAFFSFLLQQLEVIIDLSNFAKECKADPIFGQVPKGMDDRWYWEYWIVRLWNLFQRHDLNVSARKDIYKMKPGRESKFVLFVDQLQKFLPERSRQFTASYDALTQGIHRARESMQREIEAIKKESLQPLPVYPSTSKSASKSKRGGNLLSAPRRLRGDFVTSEPFWMQN
jgi:hypothetical protein